MRRMPSLFILIPLFGIVLLNLPPRRFVMRIAFWFALMLFITHIMVAVQHHPVFSYNQINRLDAFLRTSVPMDHLASIMLLCIGIVSISSLMVAHHTILEERERFKFINLLVISSIGMSGVVISRDVFSLYLFLEVTTISSFILIALEKDIYALEGSFKYLMLSSIATMMLLASIALFLMVSGGTSFAAIREAMRSVNNNLISFAVGLFLCGLLIKGGIAPFHAWVPDAYISAPAAVSVLLAGIVTKTIGIYTLMRIFTAVFNFDQTSRSIILALGALSILIGAIAAMGQNDMKRMFAYSSISQVGYIIIGFGTGTFLGVAGAVFHIFNHSIFKSLLFVNASAVESRLGTTDMSNLGGLSSRMPVTGTTSVIGMLSAAGVPPLSGFWSKLMIIVALWQSGNRVYSVTALLASALTLAYLLILQRRVFFGKLGKENEDMEEARAGIKTASIMLAVILIGSGIFFPYVFDKFLVPLQELIAR